MRLGRTACALAADRERMGKGAVGLAGPRPDPGYRADSRGSAFGRASEGGRRRRARGGGRPDAAWSASATASLEEDLAMAASSAGKSSA